MDNSNHPKDQFEEQRPGKKRHVCKHCFKELSSGQSLREHLFTHTGDMPYKCTEAECGKVFRYGSLLSIHKRIHNEVKQGIMELKNKIKGECFLKLTDFMPNDRSIHEPLSPRDAATIKDSVPEFAFILNFLS